MSVTQKSCPVCKVTFLGQPKSKFCSKVCTRAFRRSSILQEVKRCTRCKVEKPQKDFNRREGGAKPLPACRACMKILFATWRQKNRDKEIQRGATYRAENRELVRERGRNQYYKNLRDNPEKVHARQRKYQVENRQKLTDRARIRRSKKRAECNAKSKEYRRKVRFEVLDHYGGLCECCGEARKEFLALDHINGDGAEHRRTVKGSKIALWARKNGFPSILRVLCHNCNASRGYYGYCPHERERACENSTSKDLGTTVAPECVHEQHT